MQYHEYNNDDLESIPWFQDGGGDIIIGLTLGLGSFSIVKEVKRIHGQSQAEQVFDDGDSFLSDQVQSTWQKYAIKQVRKDLPLSAWTDACDFLEQEVKLLSDLNHPNLIQYYGSVQISGDTSVSILLERLSYTLEEQCVDWRARSRKMKNALICSMGMANFANKYYSKVHVDLWNERIYVLKDLAAVVAYLHRLGIVFRDLKQTNCGFNNKGVLKLFDFGLATRLDPQKKVALHQYKLTSNTGSRRYMAPEVARCMFYGSPCDVYSYAIILWEVMSLETAFKDETLESHARKAYGFRNYRPKIKASWPHSLQILIRDCWCVDPTARPLFSSIQLYLSKCLL